MDVLKEIFDHGIDYAIMGTAAMKDPAFLSEALKNFQNRIIVSIDATQGIVAVAGWTDKTDMPAQTAAQHLEQQGVKTILYTDIDKDGMMQGPNFKGIQDFTSSIKIPIIVSGGFSTVEDIRKLAENVYLVLVRTDPGKGPQGMSTLLIEKDTPGLSC